MENDCAIVRGGGLLETRLMDEYLPASPNSFALKPPILKDLGRELPPQDWPHAPVHRLSEHGIFFVTAGTLHKRPLFDTPAKRDLLERMVLSLARQRAWQLEAWAVLANHYHFVARGAPDSIPMREFLRELHSRSAIELNCMVGWGFRTVLGDRKRVGVGTACLQCAASRFRAPPACVRRIDRSILV